MGAGRGFGRGFRGGAPLASAEAEDEIVAIEREIASLQKRLDALRQNQVKE